MTDYRLGITLTREQIEYWAQRYLTDEQVKTLQEAIPHSSVPDAIAIIVENLPEEDQ
jgi:hypothetical protein